MKNLDTDPALTSSGSLGEYGSVLCLEVASIALGYRVLHAVTSDETLRVLDASPVAKGFFILAIGNAAQVETASHNARNAIGTETDAWIDREIIEDAKRAVLEAMFALTQVEVEEALVVVECATISACLASAHTLVNGHGLKVIEVRVQRSGAGGAYAFFTGASHACAAAAEDVRTKTRAAMREARIEVIESPSASFRSYFNISG